MVGPAGNANPMLRETVERSVARLLPSEMVSVLTGEPSHHPSSFLVQRVQAPAAAPHKPHALYLFMETSCRAGKKIKAERRKRLPART